MMTCQILVLGQNTRGVTAVTVSLSLFGHIDRKCRSQSQPTRSLGVLRIHTPYIVHTHPPCVVYEIVNTYA